MIEKFPAVEAAVKELSSPAGTFYGMLVRLFDDPGITKKDNSFNLSHLVLH